MYIYIYLYIYTYICFYIDKHPCIITWQTNTHAWTHTHTHTYTRELDFFLSVAFGLEYSYEIYIALFWRIYGALLGYSYEVYRRLFLQIHGALLRILVTWGLPVATPTKPGEAGGEAACKREGMCMQQRIGESLWNTERLQVRHSTFVCVMWQLLSRKVKLAAKQPVNERECMCNTVQGSRYASECE